MWKWTRNVIVTVRDLGGRIIDRQVTSNLITTVGLNMFRDLLEGVIGDGEIKYVAVGDDVTPPVLANTTLGNETFRKAVTSFAEPADGQLQTICYIAPAEAVGAIAEIGWFAGVGAGVGPGTGILISRVLYSRNKTALESVQVSREDIIAEA